MFLLDHSSQVKTSAEEVKSKLFTEDNANCKVYPHVKFIYYADLFKGFKYTY